MACLIVSIVAVPDVAIAAHPEERSRLVEDANRRPHKHNDQRFSKGVDEAPERNEQKQERREERGA